MSGPISPWYSPGGGNGIAGSRSSGWTFTKTAETSTAETLSTWMVSDDAVGKLEFTNASASANAYLPRIDGSAAGANCGLHIRGGASTDTGTAPLIRFDGRIGTSTSVATRPLFAFRNNGTNVTVVGATGAWTYTIAHTDAAAETLATWALDEDTTSKIEFLNSTSSNASFGPMIRGTRSGSSPSLIVRGSGATDSGTSAVVTISAVIGTSTAVATRPCISFQNVGTEMAQFTAGGHLTLSNQLNLKSYTVATLPSAATAGGFIYVSDETGGAVPAFSDTTNWRRVTDRAIVA